MHAMMSCSVLIFGKRIYVPVERDKENTFLKGNFLDF
jgi:hypothetical protein